MKARHRTPLSDRFWLKVDRRGPNDCWMWTAATGAQNGYGVIGAGGHDGRELKAHRVAYELAHGPIPADAYVLHSCDVKACVNPAHLRLGSRSDNAKDAVERGQHWHPVLTGEENGKTKLTAEVVADIRRRYAAGGVTLKELGREFGIHFSNISLIVRNRTWKNIPARRNREPA